MKYILVTGASRGIGKELARACARKGFNLVLVALHDEQLKSVATEFEQEYQVSVKYKETDLTKPNKITELFEWCQDEDLQIHGIINNAAYSIQQGFGNNSYEECLRSIRINVEAVALISSKFLPLLKQHEKAYILNVGSIASFMHIPYKALYAASKNFVVALSNALHYELKEENIHVSCLCPGPTITNEEVRARVEEQGFKAKILSLTSERVASEGVEGMISNKRVIIPGLLNKVLVQLALLIPKKWGVSLAGKVFAQSK